MKKKVYGKACLRNLNRALLIALIAVPLILVQFNSLNDHVSQAGEGCWISTVELQSTTGDSKDEETAPAPPSNFQAIPGESQIALSWAKGSGFDKTCIRFSIINFPTNADFLTVENCEHAWDEYVADGINSTVDSGDKQLGNASVKLDVGDAAVGGVLAAKSISSEDLSGYDGIKLWIKANRTMDEGDLQLLLDDDANCTSPLETLNIPALPANTWRNVTLNLSEPAADAAIIGIGLKMTEDKGPFVIHIDDVSAQDGPRIYFDTGTNYTHTGLINGVTYYYSAWGYSEATRTYSPSKETVSGETGLPSVPTTLIEEVERVHGEFGEYMAKRKLQQEIKQLDVQIIRLEAENAVLEARKQELSSKLSSINEAIQKIEEMDGDATLKAFALLFFFSLAGFASGLLFIKVIWRVKVRGKSIRK